MPSILAVGDTYLPIPLLRRELASSSEKHPARFIQVDPDIEVELPPLREYQGDPDHIVAELRDEEVLLVHAAPVTAELLDAAPSIELIACARGNPINIDLEAAAARGVTVLHTPAKNAPSVADLTLAFTHLLFRKAIPASRWLREQAGRGVTTLDSTFVGGQWMAREPESATLGIIGYGAIGRLVSERAKTSGMRVLAYDPYLEREPDLVPLERLLKESDVISLHAKATSASHHLLSAEALAQTKPGVFIINTARQSLVDEDALLSYIDMGHVAGAALDVYEPRGKWPKLALHPNVIITPHIGGATAQTQERAIAMLLADIDRFFRGETPRFVAAGPEVRTR